jgi:hypothetical protein
MITELENKTQVEELCLNDAWVLDTARSQKHDKPIYVTNIPKLDGSGVYDPWYQKMPNGSTFWFENFDDPELRYCTSITHKAKSPEGIEVGLCIILL